MGWKNAYRIAHIAIELFPNLAGAGFGEWWLIMKKWRRTDLALWRKHSVQKPSLEELSLAAALASELTKSDRESYLNKRRIFANERMTEYAYRLFPFQGKG